MRPGRHPTRRRHAVDRIRDRGETGDTLIEVLITVMVIGTAATALIMAFSTAIAASAEHRNLASTDTVLRSVSEKVIAVFQVQGANSVFVPCATPGDYNGKIAIYNQLRTAANPFNYTASITDVEYWSGAGFAPSGCTPGSTAPQEVTLTVHGPQDAFESVQFVVSGTGQIISVNNTQLAPPTASANTSTVNATAITVSYTDSPGAPSGQTYTATACVATDPTDCVTANKFSPGSDITGLIGGDQYSVTVTADASPGYLAATSTSVTATASSQTPQPTVTGVIPSTSSSGALTVSFSQPTTAPSGQPFTATACTDSGMTNNCSTASGTGNEIDITGLDPGTSYFVTVRADAYDGFLASTSLPFSPPVPATIGLHAPTNVTAVASTNTGGVLFISFTGSSNAPTGQTYTATACTDASMTTNCVAQGNFASGGPLTGLSSGTTYYATVRADKRTGYLAAVSAVTPGVTMPLQLSTPAPPSVRASVGTHKAIHVTFAAVNNGTTYTCQVYSDASLTTLVASQACSPSGTVISGLKPSQQYWVTVTADAAPGYLSSFPSLSGNGYSSG